MDFGPKFKNDQLGWPTQENNTVSRTCYRKPLTRQLTAGAWGGCKMILIIKSKLYSLFAVKMPNCVRLKCDLHFGLDDR